MAGIVENRLPLWRKMGGRAFAAGLGITVISYALLAVLLYRMVYINPAIEKGYTAAAILAALLVPPLISGWVTGWMLRPAAGSQQSGLPAACVISYAGAGVLFSALVGMAFWMIITFHVGNWLLIPIVIFGTLLSGSLIPVFLAARLNIRDPLALARLFLSGLVGAISGWLRGAALMVAFSIFLPLFIGIIIGWSVHPAPPSIRLPFSVGVILLGLASLLAGHEYGTSIGEKLGSFLEKQDDESAA